MTRRRKIIIAVSVVLAVVLGTLSLEWRARESRPTAAASSYSGSRPEAGAVADRAGAAGLAGVVNVATNVAAPASGLTNGSISGGEAVVATTPDATNAPVAAGVGRGGGLVGRELPTQPPSPRSVTIDFTNPPPLMPGANAVDSGP